MNGNDLYQRYSVVRKNKLNEYFINACKLGKLEDVKCLLENIEFSKHIDVHYGNDNAFVWALINSKRDVLNYLIHNYKIEKTSRIKECLIDIGIDVVNEARHMFEIRELNTELKTDLKKNKIKNSKVKI